MPAFAPAEPTAAVSRQVAEVSDNGGRHGVDELAEQYEIAGERVVEVDDVLVEDDDQCEPHRRTQVVVHVTHAVEQFLMPSHAPGTRHHHHQQQQQQRRPTGTADDVLSISLPVTASSRPTSFLQF